MKFRAIHLTTTGIIQTAGASLGIIAAVAFTGGHPSLAVLIGLAVIPLNLTLALIQIVTRMFFFDHSSPSQISDMGTYWWYLFVGWLSTTAFIGWQWPPIFISL